MDREHIDLRISRDERSGSQPPEHPTGSRSYSSSRCYHVIVLVLFLGVLIANIESLVLFGMVHVQINNSSWSNCILFVETGGDLTDNLWSCNFVLIGQLVLILFIALSGTVYLILIIGRARMLAPFRFIDMIANLCFSLLAFGMGEVTLVGLKKTCDSHQQNKCKIPGVDVDFYDIVTVSKYTLLCISVFFLVLSIWNLILLIGYCIRGNCYRPRRETIRYSPTTPLLRNNQNLYSTMNDNPFQNDSHM